MIQIINLLEVYWTATLSKLYLNDFQIAQATVRRQYVGGDPNLAINVATYPPHLAPWVNAYTSIIRSIVGFSGMFSEPDLRGALCSFADDEVTWADRNRIPRSSSADHSDGKHHCTWSFG